jgi:hypothetical protein
LASSSLVERVQLITDDPTAWSMTPAMAPRAHAKVSHDHAPPTFFTPWTTAMSPFSRLTRMTPLGSLQLSMNFEGDVFVVSMTSLKRAMRDLYSFHRPMPNSIRRSSLFIIFILLLWWRATRWLRRPRWQTMTVEA